MALEDQLGAVDPQSVASDLLAQQQPALARNDAVDPQAVVSRLLRRHMQGDFGGPLPKKQTGPGSFDPAAYGADPNAPTLSPDIAASYGAEEKTPSGKPQEERSNAEFGGPPPNASEAALGAVTGGRDYGTSGTATAVRGAASEPIELAGRGLKGIASQGPPPPTVQEAAAGEAAAPGFGGPSTIPEAANKFAAKNQPKASDSSIYKAGEAVEKFGQGIGPTAQQQQEHPIAAGVGKGVGGVLPLVAAGLVSPAAAIAGGAALFGLSGAGETYDAAIKKGADEQTARDAATLSGFANAALGALPIGSVFAPARPVLKAVGISLPEASGLVTRILAEAGKDGVVFASIGEAQEYIGQKIATMYDKDAGYSFDLNRLAASFLTGAVIGGVKGALSGDKIDPRLSSQEDIDDFLKKVRERRPPPKPPGLGAPGEERKDDEVTPKRDTPPPPPPPPPPPGDERKGEEETPPRRETGPPPREETPPPETKPQTEKPQPFATQMGRSRRSLLESFAIAAGLRDAGFANNKSSRLSPEDRVAWDTTRQKLADDIASWSDDKLRDLVAKTTGYGSKRADDDEILRKYGVSEDDIKGMSPEQKKAAAEEAVRNGTPSSEAPPEPGKREAPIDLKTGADVARAASTASQDHSHAQGEANNVQRGHATWNDLDITFETPAGGTRRGVAPDGTPFETTHPHPYGYFTGLPPGADGMHPDVQVGDHPGAPTVYVFDEVDRKTGKFRQTKTFVGFQTPQAAIQSYLGTSSKDRSQIGGMRAFSHKDFIDLAKNGGLSRPVSDAYNNVSPEKGGAAPPPPPPPSAPEPGGREPEGRDHHAAVEDVLRKVGVDPSKVRAADVARAAEIMAHEGLSPDDAFPVAVARSLIEDGHILLEDAQKVIGDEAAQALLQPKTGERGASEPPVEAPGAGADGQNPAGANGIPGGGAPGETAEASGNAAPAEASAANAEPAAGPGAAAVETDVQPAAGGKRAAEAATEQPGRGAETGNAAANQPAVKGARAPVEGGKPFEGMIENQEAYKQAAKDRREASAGGTHEIYKTKRAEEAARQGRTVQEANAERAKLVAEHEKALTKELKKVDLKRDELPEDVWRDAIDRMIDHGLDPLMAIDEAMAKAEHDAQVLESDLAEARDEDAREKYIQDFQTAHGDGAPLPPSGAQAAGAATAEDGKTSESVVQAGGTSGADLGTEPATDDGAGQQPTERGGAERPSGTERTGAGEQHVLPGAERISDAEHAQRRTDERLKPKAEQKPADEGLFGDESKQADLVDRARKEEKAADEASNFTIHPAARVPTEREAQLKGGQYSAVVHRNKPFSAERGYGDTPLSAQNDGLRRLKTTYRLTEPVEQTRAKSERETWPDGRWKARAGEQVYQTVPGFAGSPAYIHGEAYEKNGALRVRVTGAGSLMGGGYRGPKTIAYDHNWTVEGDPLPARKEKERADAIKAREQESKDAEAKADRETAEKVAAAIKSGDSALTPENAKVGMRVRNHRDGGDYVIGEIGDFKEGKVGFFTPVGEENEAPRSAPWSWFTAPKAAEKPKGGHDWTEIGKNEIGQTLYEDQNGVRSYIEIGVRHTEPVGIRPTRQGVAVEKPVHKDEWRVAEPHPTRPEQKVEIERQPEKVSTPDLTLATALAGKLSRGEAITHKTLQDEATKAFGGTMAEGKFDRKDAHDALELGINMMIQREPMLRADDGEWRKPVKRLEDILAKVPTQTVRSEEQQAFQQFSTPPHYSLAAAYAAGLRDGDVMLEPSAGTGSLVAAASKPGVKIIANELAPRRAELLKGLVGKDGKVFSENAEQLDNILPDDIKPTVVVMNPPFSQTAGRMGNKRVIETGAVHIEQALNRLEPGGRLVAIVGRGMSMGAPRFKDWWKDISKDYDVRANIGVDGSVYGKYGTTFGTRLLVIDKVKPPAGDAPVVTTEAQTVDDLMRALEPIRNGRPTAERKPTQPSGVEAPQGSAGEPAAAPSVSPKPSVVGPGERGGGRLAAEGAPRPAATSGQPVRVEAGERHEVAPDKPGRTGRGGAGDKPTVGAAPGEQPQERGGDGAERDLGKSAGGEPGTTASSERIAVETAAPGAQAKSAISDSLYEAYTPQRVRIKGAAKHPGPLVESAAMSSVEPPEPKYKPALPHAVIQKGLLSLPQLEAVVYAGQAHERTLPAGEDETPKRKGYFIGDGTGVGKGREIAGIMLDNWKQGRTKALWVSEKKKLLNDAKRDWSGLGQNPNHIFDVGKTKTGEPVSAAQGIGFVTYDTLKGGMSDQAALAKGRFIRGQQVTVNDRTGTITSSKPEPINKIAHYNVAFPDGTTAKIPQNELKGAEHAVKSRVDQIADWVGKDFDGVIAFDEAHNMGNATNTLGDRGMKEAAAKALAGMALQDRLPNARVVYVSATGATEVSNLAYADRLGLWGRGTPFASRDVFVRDVEQGGIAAMELIARDMKQLGLYTARNLSYDGVQYDRVEHQLDANQREIYDNVAEAWQVVLNNINKALEKTGGALDGKARAAAMSAFWGGHQRFFNQIITSLQMPSVVKAVEKDLKEKRQVVLQLTNTNEASQERAAAKAETAEDIEDLDITPRDQIIQLVEKSFPTQQYETYVDEKGNELSRPVVDSEGNPVENKEAVRMREALIDRLASVRVPQGPLDIILDHFGTENVAEVTGRKRRFVLKEDEKTGQRKRTEESRPGSSNQAETDAFQGGKKRVLVFSDAGGTGASYHADNGSASKDARRAHYLLQAGWRADKAVQGFGRTHRTNQASAPIFHLVTTDLKGQKRFISSIARRLGQLGALTKGERKAADQGIFSQRDNLEGTEAQIALRQFYADLIANRLDITLDDFEKQTGLSLRTKDKTGFKQEQPPITTFLNRLLSLKTDLQNAVFEAYENRLDAVIDSRQQAGLIDAGVETIRADKINKDSEQTVHTDKETNAATKHVKLTLSDKFIPTEFDPIARNKGGKVQFWAKSPNGRVYAVTEAPHLTDAASGAIIPQYRLTGPSSRRVEPQAKLGDPKWSQIELGEAKKLWQDEIAKAPEYINRDLHLITGAILPIWDRLKGSPRVVRLQTDDGERLIGRVIPQSKVAETMTALGAEAKGAATDPQNLHAQLMSGGSARLANGWRFGRRLVAGEHRIELTGPSSFSEGEQLKRDGVFTERINYQVRYFIPTDPEKGAKTLAAIIEHRPVLEASGGEEDLAAFHDALHEPGPNEQGGSRDLGPFPTQPNVPMGKQAQDYVVERGRATGLEHLVAVNQNGNVVGHIAGTPGRVNFTRDLTQKLLDPANSIVGHHNHPTDSLVSQQDIAMLPYPGLEAIWAYGHRYSVSRASLTSLGRTLMTGGDVGSNVRAMETLILGIEDGYFFRHLQNLIIAGEFDQVRGNKLLAYLSAEVLRRAGLIDYRVDSRSLDTHRQEIEKFGLEPIIDAATRAVVRSIPNGYTGRAVDRDVRSAGALRHPGDVGAVFERSPQPAGHGVQQADADRARGEGDRGDEPGLDRGLSETRNRAWQDPTHPASFSIRRKIADMLGSDRLLTLKENLQDFNARVERLQNMIEARTHDWVSKNPESPLPDNQQFYQLKRLFPGKRAYRMNEFADKHFKPLAKFMRETQISLEDAGNYLYAKHAPERNENVGKLYAQSKLFGTPQEHQFSRARHDPDVVGASGMSYNQAKAIIDKFEKGTNANAIKALASHVADIRQFVTSEMIRGSLEHPDTISEWYRDSPNYVPLRGWEDPNDAKPFADQRPKGRGGDIRGPEVQRALGRRSKADNPLVALVGQAYSTIDRAEKNLALHGLARLLKAAGDDTRKDLGVTINKGRPKRIVDRETGLVKYVDDSADATRQNAVHMKFKGADQYVVFEDQRLAEAVKRWSPYSNAGIALVGRFLGRWKSLLTHYNPEFMARHSARYFVEGLLNSVEQKERGDFSVIKYAADALPVLGNATRAIWNVEHGRDGGEYGNYWKEMKEGGGSTTMFSMREYEDVLKKLSAKASALGRSGADPRELLKAFTGVVDRMTSIIDNSTRLSAYAQARKAGKSAQQASMIAREATVDYNLRGYWSNVIAGWAPFQNVATQTGYRMGAAQARSKYMRGILLGTFALGFGISAWNYAFGGNDKDKKAYFDKLPEWTRSKSLAIFMGLSDEKGRPQPTYIPFPFNYAAPLALGQALGGLIFGTGKASEYGALALRSIISAFSELGEQGLAWHDLALEVVRPFMEISLNASWTGKHIHGGIDWQKGPNAESGFKWTPEVWKDVAQFLNNHSGGDRRHSGYLDFYPEDISYLMHSYLGGQTRMIEGAVKAYQGIKAGKGVNPADLPIGKVFYGTDYEKADQAEKREEKFDQKHRWLGRDEHPRAPLIDLSKQFGVH